MRDEDELTRRLAEFQIHNSEQIVLASDFDDPRLESAGDLVSSPYTRNIFFHGRVIPVHNDHIVHESDNAKLWAAIKDAEESVKAGSLNPDMAGVEEVEEKAVDDEDPKDEDDEYEDIDQFEAKGAQDAIEAETDNDNQQFFDAATNAEKDEIVEAQAARTAHEVLARMAWKAPMYIVVCRSSGPVDFLRWLILTIQNLIAFNDYVAARWLHEAADPQLPPTPQAGSVHSIVYVNQAAHFPIPLVHSPQNTYAQMRFIALMDMAQAQHREVIILARGISGHSTFPDVYTSVANRWAGVPIRIGYVLRHQFINFANCCLFWQAMRPFTLDITGVTALNLFHSALIDVTELEHDFTGLVPHAAAARIHEWHGEECSARTGGMLFWLAVIVLFLRGFRRNNVV